ncbi:OmpA family protein [Actinomyces sp.]|uniref:OmpA family protein n=1 Tax=Actinomyces sp. TaxID=29317 RepID=UPI0026DB0BCF|nr:OmpA family protein [Actinomyces sp.]MDO4901221.1 OmpA family protein [Actinomyces sp.]
MRAQVGPAVVENGYTVLRVVFSTDARDEIRLGHALDGGWTTAMVSMAGVSIMSLATGEVFRELNTYTPVGYESFSKDIDLTLFPVFGALPDGVSTIEVFVPSMGVAVGVPVVGADEAGFDAAAALAEAEIDASVDSGPFELNSIVVAADGSSDTTQDDVSTTVNVSGDVLFATDSAELSGESDGVLGSVVEQLGLYPSGGELTVTGHTDDVSTDEYNQDLSERRAKVVSDRLMELMDLSAWSVSVLGKGESEPRVPNNSNENRRLNRRVEVVLTPKDPSEASTTDTASTGGVGAMPEPKGPTGRGPDGVSIEIDGVPARISLDRVTRVGEYLVGTVALEAERDVSTPVSLLSLPDYLLQLRMWYSFTTTGFTLLAGDKRFLVSDFQLSGGKHRPMVNGQMLPNLVAGTPMLFPAVWPDTGERSVVLDMVGGRSVHSEILTVRLTDVPVVEE